MGYSKGYKRCGWLTERGPCLTLVPDRKHVYCEKCTQLYHQKFRQRIDNARQGDNFYNKAAWKRLRTYQLHSEPFCAVCSSPGNTIDHIIPHRGDANLFFDSSNLQTLCKRCHDSETALEMNLRRCGKSDRQIGNIKRKMRRTNLKAEVGNAVL